MNQFATLLKREFWEHRSVFLFVPAAISAFLILMMILSVFLVNMEISDGPETIVIIGDEQHEIREDSHHDMKVFGSVRDIYTMKIQELAATDYKYRAKQLNMFLRALVTPINIVLMFVIFFYLLGSLYEERKNRSILFWKSMPVSDFSVISSKLASALILAPIIVLVCGGVTQVFALLLASVLAALAGIEIWSVIWSPADLFSRWGVTAVFFMMQIVWSLPLIGWVLLVSAFSRANPLIWVFGVPIAVSIAEQIIFSIDWFGSFVTRHAQPYGGLKVSTFDMDSQLLVDMITDVDLWVGVLIGVAFIAGAIWKRGRNEAL
jgi:ABC-2 type transport system permease protein